MFKRFDVSSLRTGIMAGSVCPESLDQQIHLPWRIRVKSEMGDSDMLRRARGCHVGTSHDLQGRALLKEHEIGSEAFLRVHIQVVTLPIKIGNIKITEAL